ncbi:mitochondrial Complex1_LYR-like protein [Andalucia godoyi]|uniref:Mitochondrial Complex1_LYR-like protein n=1 Tax=Andalucia godoyi TaxID=505711 RepID=A0A8K0AH07_ANDGO|nr:mitochondrial Complex1_LYR-like protein [Andalucia godoyi]|eukprot:ANDGO_04315.mRNA.1 mitochondrial Complex1_LYR-like protein
MDIGRFVRTMYRQILSDSRQLGRVRDREYVKRVVQFSFRSHMQEEAEDVDQLIQQGLHAIRLVRTALLDPESSEARVIEKMADFHAQKVGLLSHSSSVDIGDLVANPVFPVEEKIEDSAFAEVGRRVYAQLRMDERTAFPPSFLRSELDSVLATETALEEMSDKEGIELFEKLRASVSDPLLGAPLQQSNDESNANGSSRR